MSSLVAGRQTPGGGRSTSEEVKSGGAQDRYSQYAVAMQTKGEPAMSPDEWKRKFYDPAISGGRVK
jgi:hypothetical protein